VQRSGPEIWGDFSQTAAMPEPETSNIWPAQQATHAWSPAQPFWFGAVTRPLFGWYHAPSGRARAAVVLCNAFGHEALVQHRSYRHLAQTLASHGYATLRFDYDGTGDSSGNASDPDRLEAWLSSIDAAVREVSRLSGAADVTLFGVRLGAVLAAEYARRHPVRGLILMAPPRSGKAWLREMRVMQLTKNLEHARRHGEADELGVAGHLIDVPTRKALSAIDLLKLSTQPAAHALIVARDDLPSVEVDLVRNLSDLGTDTELCVASGYADSMPEDPFKALVPTRIHESITAWLNRLHPIDRSLYALAPPLAAPSAARVLPEAAKPAPQIKERVIDLAGLFGIVTEPTEPNEQSDTAVLLMNVGANHHIGSNRMYVHLARSWAARGFRVIRLDFSGMGDSPALPGGRENDVYAQRFMSEAQRGVDYAESLGASRFVLMGLCSGAYVSYHTAIADRRVTGIVMVNPLTFHWTEGDSLEVRLRNSFKSNEDYRRRLFRVETWKRIARGEVSVAAITRELGRRTQRRATREAKSALAKLRGEIAEATDVHRGFLHLSARGAKCLLVMGAQDGGIDLIEEHLGHEAIAMREKVGFRMEVIEGPDHTFTPLWTQDVLSELVTAHLLER